MRISNSYTRVAVAFNDAFIRMLLEKYRLQNLESPKIWPHHYSPEDLVYVIHDKFRREFPGHAVILTEWMLQSITNGSGEVGDLDRFLEAAKFYFKYGNEKKFIDSVRKLSEEDPLLLGVKSKSILYFRLEDLEDLKYLYSTDPRVNKLSSNLPAGSSLVHTGEKYQIVKVVSPGAACSLASGTKWCTSGEDKANEHLRKGPLYVIYVKGKKFAQLQVTREGIEFNDLRDREMVMDQDLRDTLVPLGILA